MGISIAAFLDALDYLDPKISVLISGDHGIGKSAIVKQFADKINLKLVDVRMSQMTEGDILGLPKIIEENKSTEFYLADWFMDCVRNPRVLFLDEYNRATPEVSQMCFEIIYDRSFHQIPLHPDTRVFAAINRGSLYTVNYMDLAASDRFWFIELEPTVNEWLTWYREQSDLHPIIAEYISEHKDHLDPDMKNIDPEKVNPSRRSWTRLGKVLSLKPLENKVSLIERAQKAKEIKNWDTTLFHIAEGFIGTELALIFNDYVVDQYRINPRDIVEKFSTFQNKFGKLSTLKIKSDITDKQETIHICEDYKLSPAKYIGLSESVLSILEDIEIWDNKKFNNLYLFFVSLPHEVAASFVSKLISKHKTLYSNLTKNTPWQHYYLYIVNKSVEIGKR